MEILKINQPEAVTVNMDDTLSLKEKEHLLELHEINAIVNERGKVVQGNTISIEEMFNTGYFDTEVQNTTRFLRIT